MRRKILLIPLLLILPGALAFSMLDALSIFDPFVSGTFSVTVDGGNAPVWNQSISNVTINQNSGASTVDANMTLLGNGQCTDVDGTTPTFSVASENTSQVDCSVSGVQLNITPASSFYGNSTCIISCADATNSTNSTFTITVNQVSEDDDDGGAAVGGGGGGGSGGSGAGAECSDDDDCSSGYECNTGSGQCYTSCSSNSQCSSGYFCSSSNSCDEIECNYDSDCSGGYACDTSNYACFDSCSSNDECASGYYCDDSSCKSDDGGAAGFYLAPTFEVEPELIKVELIEGQTSIKTFTISNFKSIPRNFRLSLSGIASLAVIPTDVYIDAKSKKSVSINFKVPEGIRIGVYSGSIDVEAKEIGVVVEVRSKYSDLEIGLTLQENKSSFTPFDSQLDMRSFYPGQDLSPRVDLSSFFEQGFSLLDVEYSILNSENQVVYSENVKTQFSDEPFIKEIILPTNMVPGRHVLSVLIDQERASGLASQTFDVRSRYSILDDFVVQLSIAILIISVIFLLYVHRKAKKHRPKSR